MMVTPLNLSQRLVNLNLDSIVDAGRIKTNSRRRKHHTRAKEVPELLKGLTEGKSLCLKPPFRDDDDTLPAKDDAIDDVLKATTELLNITDRFQSQATTVIPLMRTI